LAKTSNNFPPVPNEHFFMDPTLLPFLKPHGVVIVGVSKSPEKLGYGIARNLIGSGYTGGINFVGQKGGELFGHLIHTDIAEVPDPVDLAILAVPAPAMPGMLKACAARGILAAILISAGFREAGPEGAALETECVEIARQNGMRLLGPNCIGIIDTHLPLDTSFLQPPMPGTGGIGFLSHSGAFCAAVIDWARREDLGFSQILSLGNRADITETELLPALAEDERTRVIVMYMEGVSDGIRFLPVAWEVARRKPVIALKVGRTSAGQKAAASHTGAMAGSDAAYEAAFRKAGILRAETVEQMFDWARAVEVCPLPRGRRIAILTDAGGPGVIAADALAANGLILADLSASTRSELAARLPAAASTRNPVDMLASATPQDYAACLGILLADAAVDAVMVILPPPPLYSAESIAEAIIPVISASEKPVLIALMGSMLVEQARAALHLAQIATYPFPERAASALGALARRAELLQRSLPGISTEAAPLSIAYLSPEEIVTRYGIAAALQRHASSAEEAAASADELGYPVVLKISSPDILHKSDVGGVLLGLRSRQEVLLGYAQVTELAHANRPDANIQGVTVQHQVESGQDLIIGAVRDIDFGPLMMFGSGGVEAEGLRDISFALAPLDEVEARELIERTWAGRRLAGFRNILAADRTAVVETLLRLSRLVIEHPEIKEIEINPLRALEHEAVALDVRLIL
jgi:acetate---CoA ligase (ADP-forming)